MIELGNKTGLTKSVLFPPVWTIPCCWQWSKYNTSCAIVRVHEGCQTSVRNSSNNGSQFYIRVEFRNDLLGFWRSCLFSKQKQKALPAAGRQQTPISRNVRGSPLPDWESSRKGAFSPWMGFWLPALGTGAWISRDKQQQTLLGTFSF